MNLSKAIEDTGGRTIAGHVTSTGHNFKWDHFDIQAKGRSGYTLQVKGDSANRENWNPILNNTASREKLYLY